MSVKFFGQFLLQEKEIDVSELRQALDLMESHNKTFGQLAVGAGFFDEDQAQALEREESGSTMSIGQLAVEQGLMSVPQVNEIADQEQKLRIRIGEALVQLGFMKEDRLELMLRRFDEDQAPYKLGRTNLPPELQTHLMAEYVMDYFPKMIEQVSGIKLKVAAKDESIKLTDFAYTATLAVYGKYSLRVGLTSDEAFARALLEGVAAYETDPDDATLQSVLAEFLNIVLGNAMAGIERHGIETQLDTPIVGEHPQAGFDFVLISTVGDGVLTLEQIENPDPSGD